MAPKLILRPPNPRFAELWLDWRRDKDTALYNPLEPMTLKAARKLLTDSAAKLSDFGRVDKFLWFIEYDDEIVGNIGVHAMSTAMLTAEIGYLIAPEARGRGIATAAIRLVTSSIFQETPIRKISAYVHEKNAASARALEKVGYRREGLLREHYLINNNPVNEMLYAILRKEFK